MRASGAISRAGGATPRSGGARRAVSALGILGSALVLGVLFWRLGTAPFQSGLRALDGRVLVAASAIALGTTLCCAWRWKLVAGGLGVELRLPRAVAAYYRSQFLNLTIPGGVVGDVCRGYTHGRESQRLACALRAVAWERAAGQAVQIVLTVVVLLVLPSPVSLYMPDVAIALLLAGALAALLLVRGRSRGTAARSSLWARVHGTVSSDFRAALLSPRRTAGIVLASVLVLCGHTLTFLLAARAAGSTAPISHLLPLALLAMNAMTLPNVAGWGPREGLTAWAFAAGGLGLQLGLATAVAYGAMIFVASLPGAAVLLVEWARGARRALPEPSPRVAGPLRLEEEIARA